MVEDGIHLIHQTLEGWKRKGVKGDYGHKVSKKESGMMEKNTFSTTRGKREEG